MTSIRKLQLGCMGLGLGNIAGAWILHDQLYAIVGIGFFILSIAFGLLRGEL